jgi:hypothetical protein
MHRLYLARFDTESNGYRVAAQRAIRFIWNSLGLDASFRESQERVNALVTNPSQMVLVAEHEDYDLLNGLLVKAVEYHQGAAEFVLDPASTDIPVALDEQVEDGTDPEDEEIAGVYSPEAYNVALLLVNLHQEPMAAYVTAMQLGRASNDLDFYAEVQSVLMNVFYINTGPNGPEIHIVPGDDA